jgi:hypothetical protein
MGGILGFFGTTVNKGTAGLDQLAESKSEAYKGFKAKVYQPGDFSQRKHTRSYVKVSTEADRILRRDALNGENAESNADVLKTELGKLIDGRVALQLKLMESYSYPAGSDDRAERGKHRVALVGGATFFWEGVNWLRDYFPGSTPECNGEPIEGQQKAELSNYFTVAKSLLITYGAYKMLYEPAVKNYQKEQAQIEGWIEEYDREIKGLLEDLKVTGHDTVVSEMKAKLAAGVDNAEQEKDASFQRSMTPSS